MIFYLDLEVPNQCKSNALYRDSSPASHLFHSECINIHPTVYRWLFFRQLALPSIAPYEPRYTNIKFFKKETKKAGINILKLIYNLDMEVPNQCKSNALYRDSSPASHLFPSECIIIIHQQCIGDFSSGSWLFLP